MNNKATLNKNLQIKAVERLVVAERESIAAAFERQRAEGLARNDAAFEENLVTLDKKAGKYLSFHHCMHVLFYSGNAPDLHSCLPKQRSASLIIGMNIYFCVVHVES